MANWWSYPTNYTNNTGVESVSGMFIGYPSTIIGNTYVAGFILLVFIFSFTLSIFSGVRKALAVSGFITLILSVYLIKYINPLILVGLVFITIIGLIGSKEEGI